MLLDALRGATREDMLRGIELFDAAFHAPMIRSPCLCKLAVLDDTVPAPTAAAVYNALGSGQKWRIVTQYGHFDGGLRDARIHAQFERTQVDFLDPKVQLPTASMADTDASFT